MKDGTEADATVVDPRTTVAEAPLPGNIDMESLLSPAGTFVVVLVSVVSVTVAGEVARTTTQTLSESCMRSRLACRTCCGRDDHTDHLVVSRLWDRVGCGGRIKGMRPNPKEDFVGTGRRSPAGLESGDVVVKQAKPR